MSKPITSGLPNGLRVRVWKMAPDMARAAPTINAVRARGRRRSLMMYSSAGVPSEKTARTTWSMLTV